MGVRGRLDPYSDINIFHNMWKNATWLILDSETTGFEAKDERIIEIGAILMKDGVVLDKFDQLLNPHKPLPPIITQVTGISDEMVATAPDFESAIPVLNGLFDRCDLVIAYNVPFDCAFYGTEYLRCAKDMPNKHWLDPLVWSQKIDAGAKGHKLVEVCARYKIPVSNAHRALGDVEMTAALTREMAHALPDDLQQLLSLQDLWRQQQDAARKAKYQNKQSRAKRLQ